MKSLSADPLPVSFGRRFDVSAWSALFVLSLRQLARGRRLLVLSLLFVLPAILAASVRLAPYPPEPDQLEFAFVFNLMPHALVTLTTLLFAAGIIQDDVEDQTLTYLLARPLPRWLLYLTKLAAAFLMAVALTSVFTILALVAIYWDTPQFAADVLPARALRIVALLALAQAAYCCLFGLMGLFTRRALIVGLGYIIFLEGLLASLDFVFRRLTVMYYFRVLSMRWLELPEREAGSAWSIDLATAPTVRECLLWLAGASAVLALIGALAMMRREFRMKTPDGS